ncbi:MAG: hypothetical protein AAGD32_07705 [Planctomycetota bacterium]
MKFCLVVCALLLFASIACDELGPTFYGRVVDEHGVGLPGVEILVTLDEVSIGPGGRRPGGNRKDLRLYSDEAGDFTFQCGRFDSVTILGLNSEDRTWLRDYAWGLDDRKRHLNNESFDLGGPGMGAGRLYTPDQNNPAVFPMYPNDGFAGRGTALPSRGGSDLVDGRSLRNKPVEKIHVPSVTRCGIQSEEQIVADWKKYYKQKREEGTPKR